MWSNFDQQLGGRADAPLDWAMVQAYRDRISASVSSGAKPAALVRAGWALLDAELAALPRATDCRRGCSFCCSLLVSISSLEAGLLIDAVRPDAARRQRLRENARRARNLDEHAYTRARIPCAFLDGDGSCSVHPVRPFACRSWHSLDVRACEAGFGVTHTAIPFDATRMHVFHAIGTAVAMLAGQQLGRLPSQSFGNKGELHAMVLKALDKPGRV